MSLSKISHKKKDNKTDKPNNPLERAWEPGFRPPKKVSKHNTTLSHSLSLGTEQQSISINRKGWSKGAQSEHSKDKFKSSTEQARQIHKDDREESRRETCRKDRKQHRQQETQISNPTKQWVSLKITHQAQEKRKRQSNNRLS